MGDERRDFDTPGRTNGQHDQTEPVPPQDETQPFAAPDAPGESQASGAADESADAAAGSDAADATQPISGPDETQPIAAAPDQTQPFSPPSDETHPFSPLEDHEDREDREDREPDHTRPIPPRAAAWSGRAGVSPPTGPSLRDSAPYTREIPQAEQVRPWWTPVLLGVLALGLLGILILVAWWMGRDNSPAPVDVPSASVIVPTEATETAPPPTTPAASPTAQIVQVPRLVGLELNDAVAALDALGLAYRFEYRQDDAPQGRVIESSPPEGLVVPVQTTVTLVVSTGRERSPTPSPTPSPVASATPN